MILICNVNSRDHMFKGLYELMLGNLSRKVATLLCLVTIGQVHLEIQNIEFVLWSHKTTQLKDDVTLWMGVRYCMLPPCQVC